MKALASLSLLGFLVISCGDSKGSKDDKANGPAIVTAEDNLNSENADKKASKEVASEDSSKAEDTKLAEEKKDSERRPRKPRPEKPTPKPSEEIPPIPDTLVGRGYETTTGNQMQHCLGGTISRSTAGAFASSSFEAVVTFQDVASLVMNGSSSSHDNFFSSLDEGDVFFKQEAATDLTAIYKFANVYVLGTKHIDNTKFRMDTSNLEVFRKTCGNKYVSSAVVGGVYAASVKMHFANAEVKELVGSGFVFSDFANQIMAASLTMTEAQRSQVELEISTMQVGGGGVSNPLLSTGAILKCNLNDLKTCTKILKSIGDFGQGEFRNAVENNPASLSIQVNPYAL